MPASYYSFEGGVEWGKVAACLLLRTSCCTACTGPNTRSPSFLGASHEPHHDFTNPRLFDAFNGSFADTLFMIVLPLFTKSIVHCNVWSYMAFGTLYANWLCLIHSETHHPWDWLFQAVGMGTAADHHVHHKLFTATTATCSRTGTGCVVPTATRRTCASSATTARRRRVGSARAHKKPCLLLVRKTHNQFYVRRRRSVAAPPAAWWAHAASAWVIATSQRKLGARAVRLAVKPVHREPREGRLAHDQTRGEEAFLPPAVGPRAPARPVWKSKFYNAFVLNHRVVLRHQRRRPPDTWPC